jgi:oligoendopeptidase F
MVDEFQHIVYEKPEMTPAERKAVWADLEKVYRPHMDYENDPFFGNGGFWQKQPHIFGSPFYYIDYCLASVCAMQFKVMMDEDFKKAWDNYYKLCNLSARDFFTNVIVEAGLTSPFEDGCIKNLVDKFEKKAFNK